MSNAPAVDDASGAFADIEGMSEGVDDGPRSKAAKPVLGRRASRSIRRARALYEESEWKPSHEADFLVQEATVMALMDLAEAVRSQASERD